MYIQMFVQDVANKAQEKLMIEIRIQQKLEQQTQLQQHIGMNLKL